jgi:hypothetical protein
METRIQQRLSRGVLQGPTKLVVCPSRVQRGVGAASALGEASSLASEERIRAGAERGARDVYLVFGGKTGWIGSEMVRLLRIMGRTVHAAESRLEDRDDMARYVGCIGW